MSANFLDLTGKAALITGSARSLGRNIVKRFVHAGASVMIMDIREAEPLEVRAALSAKGFKVDFANGGVRKAGDAERAAGETTAAFGSIDILVNNAGVISYTRTLGKELIGSGIRVNCVAPGDMGPTPAIWRFSWTRLQSRLRSALRSPLQGLRPLRKSLPAWSSSLQARFRMA